MARSYKARKRIALLVLLVGLPLYVILAVNVVSWFDRPPIWLEFLVYVALGIVWAIPLRSVFKGIGQADPDADET